MWAGAQTKTTPSILGQLRWTGSLNLQFVPYGNSGFNGSSLAVPSKLCNTITDFRINIQSPNNATPIYAVNGYFTCDSGAWAPFSGTLVATDSSTNPIAAGTPMGLANINNFIGNFNLGLLAMACSINAELFLAQCEVVVNGGTPLSLGKGNFIYTSVP